jgi:hypothetical protein
LPFFKISRFSLKKTDIKFDCIRELVLRADAKSATVCERFVSGTENSIGSSMMAIVITASLKNAF